MRLIGIGWTLPRGLRLGPLSTAVAISVLMVALSGCHSPAGDAKELAGDHLFRPTSQPVISSPVAWDIDKDGVKEVAFGAWDGYFYVLNADLTDREGWPRYSKRGFFPSPALADLDGDGSREILVGSDRGLLYAWHSDGSDVSGFPLDLGYQMWASPTVIDGTRIAIADSEQMMIFDAAGQPIPGWPQPMPGWADATAATDGHILAVTSLTPGDPSQGWLTAWTLDGERLPGFPLELTMDSDSSPALVDFDGDGRTWIVFGDDAGYLHVVDLQGRARAGFPLRSVGVGIGPTPTPHPPGGNIHSIEASPAVADLDNDGTYEIAVGSWDGRMYLWDDAGRELPGWPIEVEDQIISSASLVDLDGDGRLDIVVGSKDGNLYGWTMDGDSLLGFPRSLGAPVFSSPWIGDLDEDGSADIVVGANNGIHLLQDVAPLGRTAWPMFHKDASRTGWAGE